MQLLGIDIGGSGIKGALVDINIGELATKRYRIPTPQPSEPQAVGDVVAEIARHFDWKGPIGCTFPAIVKQGVVHTAANMDQSWIGTDGQTIFAKKTGCPVLLLNDADAAGVAEMEFGAAKQHKGVVILLTFGTGIGSAIFVNGVLLPNTEFGHMELQGVDAEHRAAARVRQDEGLSWAQWAERVNEFLARMEFLFSPDLFVLGGGVSKKHNKFLPLLTTQAKIIPAELRNQAGIIGAAMAAKSLL